LPPWLSPPTATNERHSKNGPNWRCLPASMTLAAWRWRRQPRHLVTTVTDHDRRGPNSTGRTSRRWLNRAPYDADDRDERELLRCGWVDGAVLWAEVSVAELPGRQWLLQVDDVTDQPEEDLTYRELHDQLTGLANRPVDHGPSPLPPCSR